MSVGENIRARRIQKGLNQMALAQKIGVGQSMIAQIERGTKIPNLLLGVEIAHALECELNDLVEGLK